LVCRSRDASSPAFVAIVSYRGKGESRGEFHLKPLAKGRAPVLTGRLDEPLPHPPLVLAQEHAA